MATLSEHVSRLFTAPVFVVVSTIERDGRPQSSVVWARVEDGQVVFSTIRGRRKCRNLERDPRLSLLAYDPQNPYSYAEIRGTATLTEEGGDALIDELSRAYDGKPWQRHGDEVRVVVRVTPEHVVAH